MTPDPKLLIMLTSGLKEYSPFRYFRTFVILKCLLLKIPHNSSRFYNTSVISTPIWGSSLKTVEVSTRQYINFFLVGSKQML